MKFIYADSLDYVDPEFDFEREESTRGDRVGHMHDRYAHEYLGKAPFDGILVSRAIVESKYNESQKQRFRREGARSFLRYSARQYPGSIMMGDCGAFSYVKADKPPYTAQDMTTFYGDAGFSHGCSIDHIIFDFDDGVERKWAGLPSLVRDRYELTLSLAADFLKASKAIGKSFTPMGVVQGWSAPSMGRAANQLVRMGYRYLALGGLVPLKIAQIERAIKAVRECVGPNIKLHLLGFGKIEELDRVRRLGVTSFDTTSPLLRAFKDAKKNYFWREKSGELSYYTAIRVPQATSNAKLKRMAMEGLLNQEKLRALETSALSSLRRYAVRKAAVDSVLDAVSEYWDQLGWESEGASTRGTSNAMREAYRRTLMDRRWESCKCTSCRETGIEAVIFRSSNRNKRRGMHNLQVFYAHLLDQRKSA